MELAICYYWNTEHSQSDEHRHTTIQSGDFRTTCSVTRCFQTA